MRLKRSTYWEAKFGNREEEYEDAYCDGEMNSFAVADGATESAFSKQWADLLVRYSCTAQLWSTVEGSFVLDENRLRQESYGLAQQWSKEVFSKALPWYAVEKAQKGAFSSLLGLTIHEVGAEGIPGSSWSALGIGDSCLFHLRNNELILRWPIEESKQFGYHPLLLSTDPKRNERIWNQLELCIMHGDWAYRDVWLLMTDALAHWFMCEYEAQQQPWLVLDMVCTSKESFREWLHQLRSEQKIRNDDVTLMVVEAIEDSGSVPDEIPAT